MSFSVVIFAAILLSGASSLKVNKCKGSDKPVPYEVDIDHCTDDIICSLKIGEDFLCRFEWVGTQDSEKLKRTVTLIDAGTLTEIMKDDDACDYTDKCPVKKGDTVCFKKADNVPDDTPKGKKIIQVRMFDGDSNDELICFSLEVMYV